MSAAGDGVLRTWCNPLPLPDLPPSNFTSMAPPAERIPHRSVADPTLVRHEGKWYLYPSCGQLWTSADDGGTWTRAKTNLTKPGHAPAAVRHGRTWYYMPDTTGELLSSDAPEGPFRRLGTIGVKVGGEVPPLCDPMLFDDDGRLYFYWGCTAQGGIWGVELDSEDPLKPLTAPKELFRFDPGRNPWERVPGNPANGWLEGAWMAKVGGRYVLTYSAAGTHTPAYAMGAYVSGSPLGPFAPAKVNPFFLNPDGLITGTGHGSVVADERGDWWVTYCVLAGAHHRFERYVGLDRLEPSSDGGFAAGRATDEPQWLPKYGRGPTGWKRIAVRTAARAAADDSLKTAQMLESVPASVEYAFESPRTVMAYRIVWREDGYDPAVGTGPMRYVLEVQAPSGDWERLTDASANDRDLLIDYRETAPTAAVAARLTLVGAPVGIRPGIADFALFGKDFRLRRD